MKRWIFLVAMTLTAAGVYANGGAVFVTNSSLVRWVASTDTVFSGIPPTVTETRQTDELLGYLVAIADSATGAGLTSIPSGTTARELYDVVRTYLGEHRVNPRASAVLPVLEALSAAFPAPAKIGPTQ